MKDRILNGLMLLTVALALLLSLRTSPQTQPVLSPQNADALLTPADPVAAYRTRREQQRRREEETLRTLSSDASCTQALREQARQMILDIRIRTEKELAAEAAAIGRGYGDAVCTLAGDTLLFVLQCPIAPEEAAQLTALAAQATGVSRENIRISAGQKVS